MKTKTGNREEYIPPHIREAIKRERRTMIMLKIMAVIVVIVALVVFVMMGSIYKHIHYDHIHFCPKQEAIIEARKVELLQEL